MASSRTSVRFLWMLAIVCGNVAAQTQYVINTVAGGGPPNGSTATAVSFDVSSANVTPAGDLLLSASIGLFSSTVYRVGSTGKASIVGQASAAPAPAAQDHAGNVFVAEGTLLYKTDPAGVRTFVSGIGGVSTSIAIDSKGVLYFAEPNNGVIRKLANGVLTILAGKDGQHGDSAPQGADPTTVLLGNPQGISTNGSDVMYIADKGNHRIYQILLYGLNGQSPPVIYTYAGNGQPGFANNGPNGLITDVEFNSPESVVYQDGTNNVYIADTGNQRIRRITFFPATVTTIAGTGTAGFSPDGTSAGTAVLHNPTNISLDSNKNVVFYDSLNYRVRSLAGGVLTTVAGNGSQWGDNGPANAASIAGPTAVAFDSAGSLYTVDYVHGAVRKVAPNGTITLAGLASPTLGIGLGIAVDSKQNVLLSGSSVVYRLGSNTPYAGVAGFSGYNGDSKPANTAYLNAPQGLAVDTTNDLFIADSLNQRVRRVDASTQVITTVGQTGGSPISVVVDSSGAVLVGENDRVERVASGQVTQVAGGLTGISGIALKGTDIFLASFPLSTIQRIDSHGAVSTVAGIGPGFSGDGGLALAARLNSPRGMATGPDGSIYFADYANDRIRKLTACEYMLNPAQASVSPAAGSKSFGVAVVDGCPWTATTTANWISFTQPSGVGNGSVSFTYSANSAVQPRSADILVGGQTYTLTQAGLVPALSITKSHTGNFTAAQQQAIYTIVVSNVAGTAPTSGAVTVQEQPPAGLTITSMSGTGWNCNLGTCTRSDALAAGSTYPAIAVLVNVAVGATSPQVNQASVSGGGSPSANTSDSTVIVQSTLSLNRTSLNFANNGSLATSPQNVALSFTGGAGLAWTAAWNQPNLSVTPSSGTGNAILQISAGPGPSGTVTVTATGAIGSPRQIQVNVAGVTEGTPFGSFDTPANNTTGISGSVAVTGWAVDNIEITKVDIWREPVGSEPAAANGLVYIGDAVLVADARPDVQAANPNAPLNYRAGWGYLLLTTELPPNGGATTLGNGTYKLHAIIHNKGGTAVDLGTRTITVDNAHAVKPFGTIDTPGQGDTISGASYVNFGWALTQQPFMIPTDGSTILVFIDGVQQPGHATYNNFRSDIATLFPGYANSNAAIGYYIIDTTKLSNSVHTIFWIVTDSGSRADGIGSRYFSSFNNGSSTTAPPEPPTEESLRAGVRLRQGYDLAAPSDAVIPQGDGTYTVHTEEMGRIELTLGAESGHMLVAGEQTDLPIGSTLKGGVFYWQPAVGFLGDYSLLFERPDGTAVRVNIRVRPKRYLE